ncbi:glycerol-3-phosphate dehydrogenase [Celerinatantimonas sp. YJH-8]|uniref:glycerol-3-phosphate dehydrogenase n=1 Tax=Celerinatantimonas sp. YJH-8 TaxID=3228714 RepID=UPI0038C52DF7
MHDHEYDLIVIGGGINGAGIASDAALRGLRVALLEAKDFGGATSSASSKLIHGGLRYLEQYEFRLVREALAEREILMAKAPHLITPMRFRLPHRPQLRPAWMIRIGLFLYDHLAKRQQLSRSRAIRFDRHDGPLLHEIRRGFEYADGWVDDARLVLANVQSVAERGGSVWNYCRCQSAFRQGTYWQVEAFDERRELGFELRAKALVNAAGPWVNQVFDEQLKQRSPRAIRLIQGSHIVVPRIHREPYAYILQNDDQRIVFVIPYQQKYSLVGTTDVEFQGDPRHVHVSDQEVNYLIGVVNAHFKHNLRLDDVLWSYSGVRPLCADESGVPQAITRDYTIELDEDPKLPLLSVFGGKLTTYRKLAETAVDRLAPYFESCPASRSRTDVLPGGDCDPDTLSPLLHQDYPFLTSAQASRIAHAYGSRARLWLRQAKQRSDLGQWFGDDLSQAEIDYLVTNEWAYQSEDILWRRTKLGLVMSESQQLALNAYLSQSQLNAYQNKTA